MGDEKVDRRTVYTKVELGNNVVKTGAVVSADDDLFTVVGLNLITLMYGEVTTALTGAGTVALNEKANSIAIAAETTITSDAIGTLYLVSGHADAPLNGGGTPTIKVAATAGEHDEATDRSPALAPILVNGGAAGVTIESTETGDDATGVIDWTIFYLPLEEGAYIEAAA